MTAAYHPDDEPTLAIFERVAEGWQPYRRWVSLLLHSNIRR